MRPVLARRADERVVRRIHQQDADLPARSQHPAQHGQRPALDRPGRRHADEQPAGRGAAPGLEIVRELRAEDRQRIGTLALRDVSDMPPRPDLRISKDRQQRQRDRCQHLDAGHPCDAQDGERQRGHGQDVKIKILIRHDPDRKPHDPPA